MKKRLYISGILLMVIALIAIVSVWILGKKVEVSASSTVFINQPYHVHFSHKMNDNSIQEQFIYITNAVGEKVKGEITLEQNKQSISIENLQPGQYVLHIEEGAFKEKPLNTKKQEVEFKVIEELEKITSLQELEDFFQNAINTDVKNHSMFETTVEESKSADMSSSNEISGGASNDGAESYSTTNNQVEDIEEGDIVVTDGKYIYATLDNQIVITDGTNPNALKIASKITLDGNSYPSQLMIHQNMLIVVMDDYVETNKDGYASGNSMTKVAFYSMENPSKPKLIREFAQDGFINGVRKYNNILYIVSNKAPEYWLLEEEKEVELRPYTYDSAQDKEVKPMELEQLTILPGSNEPNYTIISSIDLNNFEEKKIETKGFLGGSSSLYMSENALYLTAVDFLPRTLEQETDSKVSTDIAILPAGPTTTDIFKFTIDGMKVEFLASTSITGSLLNQFSMDEHNGYFRIATTEGDAWGGTNETTKNHLFIYNDKLEKVGEVTDLAKGERIYSARFMGDKAYIVTFKQVDPLFVIDLQNPKQPKVLGELKIPGYSNYLHPLDEHHLIGIGYDTESRVDSTSKQPIITTKGIKISLFDITDYKNPKEQDSVVIGGRGTHSEIEYNHKALFRNEEYNYFGFPVTVYEGKGEYDVEYKGSGAVIYEITADNGIELKGNLITPAKQGEEYENWESLITRLLYIEDTLYTVSRDEMKSYNLPDFNALGSVKLK